jgi:hypothetical protein
MAWLSLVAGLGFPLLLLYTESPQLGAVAGPFYIFVGAVVGAYIGFATVDDKWTQDARHETNSDRYVGRRSDFGPHRMDSQRVEVERQDQPTEPKPRPRFDEGF